MQIPAAGEEWPHLIFNEAIRGLGALKASICHAAHYFAGDRVPQSRSLTERRALTQRPLKIRDQIIFVLEPDGEAEERVR